MDKSKEKTAAETLRKDSGGIGSGIELAGGALSTFSRTRLHACSKMSGVLAAAAAPSCAGISTRGVRRSARLHRKGQQPRWGEFSREHTRHRCAHVSTVASAPVSLSHGASASPRRYFRLQASRATKGGPRGDAPRAGGAHPLPRPLLQLATICATNRCPRDSGSGLGTSRRALGEVM